jgi:hypothetical protein
MLDWNALFLNMIEDRCISDDNATVVGLLKSSNTPK